MRFALNFLTLLAIVNVLCCSGGCGSKASTPVAAGSSETSGSASSDQTSSSPSAEASPSPEMASAETSGSNEPGSGGPSSADPGADASLEPGSANGQEEMSSSEEMPSSAEAPLSPEMTSSDLDGSSEGMSQAEYERSMESEMQRTSADIGGSVEPSEQMMSSEMNAADGFSGESEGPSGASLDTVPEPEPLPTDYLSQAKMAFAAGAEDQAHKLLLAHLVSEPELALEKQTYADARWSGTSRRPRWMLRVGLGVNNVAVRHDGDLHPIENDMSDPVEGGARGGHGAGGSGGGGGGEFNDAGSGESRMDEGGGAGAAHTTDFAGGGDAMEEIRRYSGLVGALTVERFQARFSQGDFGKVFSSVVPQPIDPPAGGPRSDASREMGSGDLEMRGSGAEMAEDSSAMMEESSAMAGGSGEPAAMAGAAPGFADMGSMLSGKPRIVPGLEYLGAGHPRDLMEKAKESGLDAFLQIDVSVTRNPATGTVSNDCGVRWIQVSTGRPLGRATGKINNRTVYQAMKSRSLDPSGIVGKEIDGLFGAGYESLKLQAMPELTQAQAMSRIGSLIISPTAQPMETLSEVRLYSSMNLITDEQVHLAFDLLMGDDGLVLAAGPEEERVEVLTPFAPKVSQAY